MKNVYNGDLIVEQNEILSVEYTEITGNVYIHANATFKAFFKR